MTNTDHKLELFQPNYGEKEFLADYLEVEVDAVDSAIRALNRRRFNWFFACCPACGVSNADKRLDTYVGKERYHIACRNKRHAWAILQLATGS